MGIDPFERNIEAVSNIPLDDHCAVETFTVGWLQDHNPELVRRSLAKLNLLPPGRRPIPLGEQ